MQLFFGGSHVVCGQAAASKSYPKSQFYNHAVVICRARQAETETIDFQILSDMMQSFSGHSAQSLWSRGKLLWPQCVECLKLRKYSLAAVHSGRKLHRSGRVCVMHLYVVCYVECHHLSLVLRVACWSSRPFNDRRMAIYSHFRSSFWLSVLEEAKQQVRQWTEPGAAVRWPWWRPTSWQSSWAGKRGSFAVSLPGGRPMHPADCQRQRPGDGLGHAGERRVEDGRGAARGAQHAPRGPRGSAGTLGRMAAATPGSWRSRAFWQSRCRLSAQGQCQLSEAPSLSRRGSGHPWNLGAFLEPCNQVPLIPTKTLQAHCATLDWGLLEPTEFLSYSALGPLKRRQTPW